MDASEDLHDLFKNAIQGYQGMRSVPGIGVASLHALMADYTVMGEGLANNLLLRSRVCSRHIKTYTFRNPHSLKITDQLVSKRSVLPTRSDTCQRSVSACISMLKFTTSALGIACGQSRSLRYELF